jgi:hypothetical protein
MRFVALPVEACSNAQQVSPAVYRPMC